MQVVEKTRIPVESNGIQYNFCKNPKCEQFGVPALQVGIRGNNTYNLTGADYGTGVNVPMLRCNCCNEHLSMKSNIGIAEELDRLSAYLSIHQKTTCCTNAECTNKTIPVGTKKAYRSFGCTAGGAKRYRCNACKKTLSIAKPTQGQHDTTLNVEIFKLLVNKVPLSRIINILNISWSVLYSRLDFIHKQCLAFASEKESDLKVMKFERLYLATDRQEYSVNWTERKDKRNVVLAAMATADNSTGYVFGIHPNFDHSVDKEAIELDALVSNDSAKPIPFRKYARFWLETDYINSSKRVRYGKKAKKNTGNVLKDKIEEKYEEAKERVDVEVFDKKTFEEKLPNYGVQVHAEYTMIAHFHFLKSLLGNVDKWRMFLDQDSGIRGACLSVFKDEIKNKTAEAFYVSIEKALTVDQKRKLKAEAKKNYDIIKANNPTLSDNEIKIELLKREIQMVQELGSWKDKWVHHPLPNMAESNKAMCWLTEHDEFDLTHKAWLYNKASLHGVDSFFQKIRRRVAMLERPIHTPSNGGRTWNGYGAYNPAMIIKLLEIFRVVHNFIDIRKEDGESTTAAMRLGLMNKPMDYKDVLNFE
jgi:transposase-like protein